MPRFRSYININMQTRRQKHIVLLLLLTSILFTGLSAQNMEELIMASNEPMVKSSSTPVKVAIPKELTRKFRRDAARLALRLESKKEELRYQSIIIPKNNMESIYEVLYNIYTTNETAQSISKCNVHTFPNPSIDHLVIVFDRDIEWAEPLQEGISETDSDEINDLLEDYDLIIEKHVQWNDDEDAITVRSKEPLNMSALANEFYNVDGVNSIDLGIPKIGGNDININRIENGWEVQFLLRFGSFITGKGKTHIWTYNAMDDGNVKFIRESGDPVPEYMRCHFQKRMLAERI